MILIGKAPIQPDLNGRLLKYLTERCSVRFFLVVLWRTVVILWRRSVLFPVISNDFDRLLRGTFIVVSTLSRYACRAADQHQQYQQFLDQLLHTGLCLPIAFLQRTGGRKRCARPLNSKINATIRQAQEYGVFALILLTYLKNRTVSEELAPYGAKTEVQNAPILS